MPPQLLIIADDLTGANDTGVQFAKQGIDVLVIIHHDQDWQALANDCQVLVINTESRHLSSDEAFERVYLVAAQGVKFGITQFYKKTDSTLRGNLGSEFAALLNATGAGELYFAPAYPKLNRITRDGVQFVNGVPVHQSSFANDPLNPVQSTSITAIIAPYVSDSVCILDAESNEDLQRIAHQFKDKTLLAGSAGFAEFLPAALQLPTTPIAPLALSFPMLVVNGSLHKVSLQQIAYARELGWQVIAVSAETTAATIIAALASARRVVLTTATTRTDESPVSHLAALVAQTLDQVSLSVLAVFGGDTLAGIAQACNWMAFRPRAEFLPGMPLVQVDGEGRLILLSKAGGFGDVDLIAKIQQATEMCAPKGIA
jgi:D-threonate/D-erythronate kinase